MLWCIGIEDVFYFVRDSAFDEGLGGALWILEVWGVVSHFLLQFFLGGGGGWVGAVVWFLGGRVWVF